MLRTFLYFPIFFSLVCAQGSVRTLFPAAIPLAVKTPYLNTWYQSTNNSGPLSSSWPQFWTMDSGNMGWEGRIRVNGTTYQWLGDDSGPLGTSGIANVTYVQITPTRSIVVMQTGPMQVTITFLSPVEPDDWVKQSIPFSYISVEVQSVDGNRYPVQLYSDISAEWASGDRSSVVQWSNANTGSSIYHKIQLQSPRPNAENASQAQDGTTYYAMSTSQSGISWQIDIDDTVRDGFQKNGKLTNTASTTFAPIAPNWSICGFAVDLGTIQSTTSSITWSVGYVRDPSITYTAPGGAVQQRRPYYVTQYPAVEDVIDAFTGDYAGAYSRAVALDQKIMGAAAKISSQYSDIVSLATRQTMSTLDFTVGTDSNGNLVHDDIKLFMKNLGTDRRINPVEHIYAAFPMFLYLNASIGGALLQPLLETQANLAGQSFAALDVGNTYPTAPGSEAVSNQGVEQSGNMLIMELAHARISGDGTLLSQYYDTTKRWADYLVSNALKSENQTNQDGDTADLANTALKGIIGVKAMAEIAHALGENSDAAEYGNQASSLFNSWLLLAQSSDGSRLLGSYGNQQSWSLMYNLFADKMLGLNFVPQSVIDMQTQYLNSLLATAPQWGLSIDSETSSGNAAWTMFASAFVSDTTVRDALIEKIHNHANSNLTTGAFPEIYSTSDNSYKNGAAGPALGGMFSHLALTVPNQTIFGTSTPRGQPKGGVRSKSSTNVGAIVGGVIGGLAIVGIVAAIFVVLRKRRMQKHEEADTADVTEYSPHHPPLMPYRQHPSLDYVPVVADMTAGFAGIGTRDMGEYDRAAISPSPDLSTTRKARREAMQTRTRHPASPGFVAASSNVGSQAGSASSRDLLSRRESISTTDVVGLRTEVENLRRVMQDIRAERLEPPPEYAE